MVLVGDLGKVRMLPQNGPSAGPGDRRSEGVMTTIGASRSGMHAAEDIRHRRTPISASYAGYFTA